MTDTAKAILELGVFVVLAAAFIWMALKKDRDYVKAVQVFTEVMTQSNTVIANHMTHETAMLQELSRQNGESFKELTRAIDRLCIYLEMPNRDYSQPP